MISFSWENLLKNGIRVGLIISVIMPLVLNEGYLFPMAAQIFFFQAIVLIVFGLFAGLIIFACQPYLPKITPLTLGLAVFTASFFISAFFGFDRHLGLWDSSHVMVGAVFMLFGFIYYLILSQVFLGWHDWRWLLRFVAGISGAIVLLGIILGIILPEGGLCQSVGLRMSSVFGNPVFFGGYTMMAFFLGILGLAMERSFPFRIFFAICSSLTFLGVLFSGTRSAMLGLGAGLILIVLFYVFKLIREKKLLSEARWIGLTLLVAIFVLGAWQAAHYLSNQKETASIAGIARMQSVNLGNRLFVWRGALEAWPEKPFLGWGPNNFEYAFDSHYQPESFLYGEAETWPDGVWNIWLESLVERGLIGLLALLFLVGIIFWSLFTGYRKGHIPFFGLSIGITFLLAYFIHLSFIFELASMAMLFFLFLAFVNSMTMPRLAETSPPLGTRKRSFFNLTIFIIFLFTVFIFISFLPTVANIAMYSASRLLKNNPGRAMEIYDKVVKNIPTPYLSDLQTRFFVSGLPYLGDWEGEEADRFVYLGLAALQAETDEGKPRTSSFLYQAKIARQASYALGNDLLLEDAEKFLEEARLLSPKRQQVVFSLATVKAELGNFEEAFQLVKEGIGITPAAPQGWLRLMWVYKMNNNQEEAQRVLQEAQNVPVVLTSDDLETAERILSPECCKKGEIF